MPPEKLRIEKLFQEIQHGNKVAFEGLFCQYHHRLITFALQYIKDQEIAQDIVSELFVKIWLRRNELSKVIKPEVYLYIAIKNACLNQIRSDKKRKFLFTEWSDNQSLEESTFINMQSIEDKELVRLLDQAVLKLPKQRRIIFSLIKEQGLKSGAVAEILEISVRTVESQLYKAVKSLADSISVHLGYHPQRTRSQKGMDPSIKMFFC